MYLLLLLQQPVMCIASSIIIIIIINNNRALSDALYQENKKKYRISTYRNNNVNTFVNVWHMNFVALRSLLLLPFWNNDSIKCIVL